MDWSAPLLSGEWVSSSVAIIVVMGVAGLFVTGIAVYVVSRALRSRRPLS